MLRAPRAPRTPLGGDDTTADPVIATIRNFYKVEPWKRDDRIERMLFAGTSLDRRARCLPTRPGIALERG
jgi:hypothetical protein